MDPEERLIELYKICDENHRFFVDTRFKTLSLYIPAVALALTVAFFNTKYPLQIIIAIMGIVLTIFLYVIELKHWILSNISLRSCNDLCLAIGYTNSLHESFTTTHSDPLPESKTFLDTLLFERGLSNQHRATAYITTILIFYWALLIISSIMTGMH